MSNEALWLKIEPCLEKLTGPNRKGEYRAICPFHADTKPSLDINPEKGIWYCHGACGEGGSLFQFAQRLGIFDTERPTERGQKTVTTPEEADAEFDRRGIRPETRQHFLITTNTNKRAWSWPVQGGRRYKKWPGYEGNKNWHIDGTPNRLYGLGSLSETETVYYVSGEPDLWIAWQAGLPAVCHIFGEGKGKVPKDAADELKARGIKEVQVIADLDDTGRKQEREIISTFRGSDLVVKVLALPEYLGEGGDLNDLYLWLNKDDEAFKQIVEGLPEKEIASSKPALMPKEKSIKFHCTDQGNGERLVARHGKDLRYCYTWKTWLVWDGRRWKCDDTGEVERRAKETARSIYIEAGQTEDDNERKELVKWARSSESQHRRKAMIESAQSELGMPVKPDELDGDPWLLNVLNGTLDLRTGELRPHTQTDLITKLAPVQYDPDAKLDLWDSFLQTATGGNKDLAAFIQRAVGYTLTGDTREETLFFAHGPTNTGKSTFTEAIKGTLGDYAMTADFETFLKRRDIGNPRPDIARLAGARLVASLEVDEGKRLAEGLVKLLTGGDTVTTRFLFSREFEFVPAFKLWLAANHAPGIKPHDEAMWRRIKKVPFEHVVPEKTRDPKVKAQLREPSIAGAAILAWAVRGCMEWQGDGLGTCEAVEGATRDLRDRMDPLKDFLAECCILDGYIWTSAADLRQEYEEWAKENGVKPVYGKKWGESLRSHGCESRSVSEGRGWQGVGIIS